jgi:diaminopimelate dehydrogenase
MDKKIKIGLCGYGNLGKGVESEILKNPDFELAAVFTRRPRAGLLGLKAETPAVHIDSACLWKDKIDVMILCGGSAGDLPSQGPFFANLFNTVDSYDNHANIPQYFKVMDNSAKTGGNVSVISVGWDPGLFSLMRLYMGAVIPDGKTYTFWGKGVSQGHSEAIRGIEGVEGAVQYTIPSGSAIESIRAGKSPELTAREKHTRLCYVAASPDADKVRIEREIKEMPNYFADYDTTVNFISMDELKAGHSGFKHGGNVIHTGMTGNDNSQLMEYSLKLDSNPEFTASVLLAYARAAYRLSASGVSGARTVYHIPPILLSRLSEEETIRDLL